MTARRWKAGSGSLDGRRLTLIEAAPRVAPVFAIGDLAMLRSGGPLMMIVDLQDGRATAAWEDDGAAQELTVSAICLRLIARA